MARKIKQEHGGELIRYDKGESGNPNGRPKKYVSTLKEQGYKLSEINDCILNMLSMNKDEMEAVKKNKDATMLEKTIAAAMLKSLANGSLYSMETLLSRTFGKPVEKQESDVIQSITVKFESFRNNPTQSTPGPDRSIEL